MINAGELDMKSKNVDGSKKQSTSGAQHRSISTGHCRFGLEVSRTRISKESDLFPLSESSGSARVIIIEWSTELTSAFNFIHLCTSC